MTLQELIDDICNTLDVTAALLVEQANATRELAKYARVQADRLEHNTLKGE